MLSYKNMVQDDAIMAPTTNIAVGEFPVTDLIAPPAKFSSTAHIQSHSQYLKLHKESLENPEKFWQRELSPLYFEKEIDQTLISDTKDSQWFPGSTTNISYNCLDRHIKAGNGDEECVVAISEVGHVRRYTYKSVLEKVSQVSNTLLDLGVKKGDVVLIYMPMIPECLFAMQACLRIGAQHTVVFAGFAPHAVYDRFIEAECKVVITADGSYRRGKCVELLNVVREMRKFDGVESQLEHVIVLENLSKSTMLRDKEISWSSSVSKASIVNDAIMVEANHPSFILYTSGSTGKPKGIQHSTAGYMAGAYLTSKYIFDLKPSDVYWCTGDFGWVTGHTYVAYGPLLNGTKQIIYEGSPGYPDFSVISNIIEEYKVSIFYTSPTLVRALMRAGDNVFSSSDITSLRLLGSVGEPISPEVWRWFYKFVGHSRCPIVDTFWQTETGSIVLSAFPGATPLQPGCASVPFFGIDARVVDPEGNDVEHGTSGRLVFRSPWPSMLKGVYKNRARYLEAYWEPVEGAYLCGDGAKMDQYGHIWIEGRLDDVLNVSGHRIGTAEIEGSIISCPAVAESAVVGFPHDLKGQGIAGFVVLKDGCNVSSEVVRQHVSSLLGAICRPDYIFIVKALPKTRSGKIMRRLIQEVVQTGVCTGNTATLENPESITDIIEAVRKFKL